MNTNAFAFLTLISHTEGTDHAADPYRVVFGFRHTIIDLSNHPAVTKEWRGESLDSLGLKYIGLISTAAGRYQINKPTWLRAQEALHLPDFTGPSQDQAALWLIQQKGALADVEAGNVRSAIAKCRNIWASLPGGDSGQPEASTELCLNTYTAAGGELA